MGDPLDFPGLLAEVEASTVPPDFAGVTRRARTLRRRSRLATLAALLAVVAVAVPGTTLAARQRTSGADPAARLDDQAATDGPSDGTPEPSGPARVSVAAVGGVDLSHLYALVDVCHGDSCDLRLCAVRPAGEPNQAPIRARLLRTDPAAWLAAPSLQPLTRELLLVEGNTRAGHESVQIDAGTSATSPAGPGVSGGQRATQLSPGGTVSAFDLVSGRMVALPAQPDLAAPTVVGSVAADKGIWVYGMVPGTGRLGVSVSVDGGDLWTTSDLGVPVGAVAPVLATYDGQTGYLLARLDSGGYALFATHDAGQSWHRVTTRLPWPDPVAGGGPYGLVVRPDGALLAWLDTGLTVAYLQSPEGGGSFTATAAGPGGPVYAVSDGYVALGTAPKLSRDAATWFPATIPGVNG